MTTQTSQAVEAAVQQPEALRLAAWLNEGAWHQMKLGDVEAAGRELRRLHNETVALRAALTSQQEVAEGEELRQRHLDLLQDVLDAKDVMRAAGIGQCDFPTMFKEFAASRSAGVAGGVDASRGQDSFHVANAETKGVQGDGREAKSYSGSVHLGSGASCGVHGRAVVSAYSIQISDKPFAEEITVQRMRQIDGTPLWSVKLGGNCLNKSGEWEWEPMPSSRDDEFLARCRFESPEAAIDAAILSTKGTT